MWRTAFSTSEEESLLHLATDSPVQVPAVAL